MHLHDLVRDLAIIYFIPTPNKAFVRASATHLTVMVLKEQHPVSAWHTVLKVNSSRRSRHTIDDL